MRNLTFYENGKRFDRVSKAAARRAYENGVPVIFCPVKMHPFGMLGGAVMDITRTGETFQKVINAFEFYNCTPETGTYTAFYIAK